jgi:Na+-transporting NADH:ubiquinone oxidoreductase subunit A
LKVLGKLSQNIIVAVGEGDGKPSPVVAKACGDMEPQVVRGAYPALDPGVVIYHTKQGVEDNRSWFLDGQDVVLLGELMTTGKYPTEHFVVVAGPMARERRHVKTRLGVPLVDLARSAGLLKGACRYVVGGVFTGFRSDPEGYMGFYESALNLLPEGVEREFLSLFRPGYNKPSFSRTFLSVFNNEPLISDCNTHGELRACIACNHCPPVCPVGILPQLTYKCILAGDLDGALAHGLLDCVECGLCTYVCPAKIELLESLKSARADYYKEQSR